MIIVECSANWTEVARREMGWQDLPEDTVTGNVNLQPSKLAAEKFRMKPGKGFEKHEFELTCKQLCDFKIFFPTKEEEAPRLKFHIHISSSGAESALGKFGRVAGDATGVITVTYDADAQGELDLADKNGQGKLEEANGEKK